MTRRRILFGLLLASAALACFGGWLWMASGPRVTRARFEQVKKGMSREEVIHIVGGPPGDYSDGRAIPLFVLRFYHVKDYEQWLCDDGHLLVLFDDTGTATDVLLFHVSEARPPTLTEKIRSWLGL
jgi:hypothetical protein